MANLIYTNKCNLSCPFYFAGEDNLKDSKEKIHYYSSADLRKRFNFLKENAIWLFKVKPTQYPDPIEHAYLLIESSKSLFFMTNGIGPFSSYEYGQGAIIDLCRKTFEE